MKLQKHLIAATLIFGTLAPVFTAASAQDRNDSRYSDGRYKDHGIGTGKGALIGGAGGAGIGALAGGGKGTLIGGALGAGGGALVGHHVQTNRRRRNSQRYYANRRSNRSYNH